MAGTINKPKKPSSKRQPVGLRHRIEKASAAKQRKMRKQAKNNPEWRSKLKKDPGIPNLFPYKEKLLHQIEETRLRKVEEARRRRELAKTGTVDATPDAGAAEDAMDDDAEAFGDDGADAADGMDIEDGATDESNPMAALLASARAAARDYDAKHPGGDGDGDDWDAMDDDDDNSDDSDGTEGHVVDVPGAATSRRAYDKVFKQVVEQADVVLYVLDARDPEGTRSRDVERAVLAASGTAAGADKRLILVLNKADLVPPAVLKGWLTHLRGSFPTLPLRAAGAAANAQTLAARDLTVAATSGTLFRALKAYAASRNLRRAVSVGVIGYPNVGKSSVINALLARLGGGGRRAGACPAGAEAGVTTAIRTVKIDSKLTLLDSPGIVFPSAANTVGGGAGAGTTKSDVHANLILLNAIPPKLIEDPVPAVTLLLRRLSTSAERMQRLAALYDLPALMVGADGADQTTDFLVQVARKRGRLGRGGVPNLHAAAMTVITDWRDGRIQGWVDAPRPGLAAAEDLAATATTKTAKTTKSKAAAVEAPVMADQKQIVTEWAAEFKLDGLWGDDETESSADTMAA